MERTLQQVIEDNKNIFGLNSSEYIIRVVNVNEYGIEVYIRPSDRAGETINFIINGNRIILPASKAGVVKEKLNDLLNENNEKTV